VRAEATAEAVDQVDRDPRVLTTLELFAGAGGLAIGVHRAGFEVADLVELNETCCETLRANADLMGWKDARDIQARDVRDIDFTAYRDQVSLLAAGAPCQPFSRAGRRQGRHDHRDMLPEVVRAVAQVKPRAFLIENVRGLLFQSSTDHFKSIVARLRNPTVESPNTSGSDDLYHLCAGDPSDQDAYRVEYKVLNAADFGLPQNRERLFIVGLAQDEEEFQWPTGSYSRASLIEDLRGEAYWNNHPGVSMAARGRARKLLPVKPLARSGTRWRTLRDLLADLGPPAKTSGAASDPSHVLVPGARLYGRHTGSRVDWVGKTVKAGVHGSPGGEHIVVFSPKRFRYLSVRECAELQGFPRAFRLPEKRTPAMRQLGNAVPVTVAEAVAAQIRECLDRSPATLRSDQAK
jgi:DNA (cytosine-5)-methyltransferase 1